MQKFSKIWLSIATSLFLVLTPVAVSAESGSGSSGSGSTTPEASGSGSDSSSDPQQVKQQSQRQQELQKRLESLKANQKQTSSEIEQQHADKVKAQAEDLLKDFRAKTKEHSAEQRQKNCQAAKNGLEHRLQNLQKNAAAYQAKVDEVLQKLQTAPSSVTDKVSNYVDLVTAATNAQTTAKGSVAALSGLSVNLACSSNTVATNVATFKVASNQAKTDLQAYKTAVKAILTAIEQAKGTETQQ